MSTLLLSLSTLGEDIAQKDQLENIFAGPCPIGAVLPDEKTALYSVCDKFTIKVKKNTVDFTADLEKLLLFNFKLKYKF